MRATCSEFMIAGATAVQVGTANFVDPLIWPNTCIAGIGDYMTRHGIASRRVLDRLRRHPGKH